VYEAATRRLLTDFLNGVNGTILVYGQTGSGTKRLPSLLFQYAST
jgi:Tfp pilus assembly pilus retraction ATPase PilT